MAINDYFDFDTLLDIGIKKIIIAFGLIVFAGVYLGVILFGENSILALWHLKQEKQELSKEITDTKNKNQELQKEYFLLKQLEPKNN
ncbi:MAG: septum formation initiator family protein [Sulfurovaceae bacterium]|jgi:cell division protein FtsB|nr:septum formation initiator family protein [Sulfurovaceae bacterium]